MLDRHQLMISILKWQLILYFLISISGSVRNGGVTVHFLIKFKFAAIGAQAIIEQMSGLLATATDCTLSLYLQSTLKKVSTKDFLIMMVA